MGVRLDQLPIGKRNNLKEGIIMNYKSYMEGQIFFHIREAIDYNGLGHV